MRRAALRLVLAIILTGCEKPRLDRSSNEAPQIGKTRVCGFHRG